MRRIHIARWTTVVYALFLGAALAPSALAGEMEPPGPPEPTMKPLNELEPRHPIWPEMLPFTIGEPGSYYLTASAFDVPGGIEIVTSNVTIDLNGFVLDGNATSGIGIDASTAHEVTVIGGTIRDFSGDGVVLGDRSTARDVRLTGNGGDGVRIGRYGRIAGVVATQNSGDGIEADWYTSVEACVSGDNRGRGIVATGARISGCTSQLNDSHGIEVDDYSLITGNVCSDNGSLVPGIAAGILATGQGNRIDGNLVTGNDIGLQVTGTNNIVIRNTANFLGQGTPYSIAAGNRRGPIVDASITDDLSTITNGDHPWANFIF